jgi:hypothetical protein
MNRCLLAAVLAASCTPAPAYSASMQARFGELMVTVYDAPCDHPAVLALILDPYKSHFRRASITTPDRTIEACWINVQGIVLIVDENGGASETPPQAYKTAGGV